MSRIGKLPITIPDGVTITISDNNIVKVKGKLGELEQQINPDIKINISTEEKLITVERFSDEKEHRSLHGLSRSLINNMVEGVSKGFEIKQELVGVGYKATVTNNILELSLGYSHDIWFQMPKEVQVEAITERRNNPIVTLKSFDKQLIGHIASKIRSFRPPEPYKGKGIKYVGEQLRKKAGKSANV